LVTTGSDGAEPGNDTKAAIEVTIGSGGPEAANSSKAATSVITGFLPSGADLAQNVQRTASSSEPYRELIELELTRGRNAMGIFQDLVDGHGWLSECAALRAGTARSHIAGSASHHRDAAW
jgi:hypothetical protein